EPHALVRREPGNVAALQEDLPLGRLDDASQEVDQRRLAGAVGADQRLARAGRNAEGHAVGREQRPELFYEAARFERRACHAASPRTGLKDKTEPARPAKSQIRTRPINTSATSSAPIQNSQYSGVAAEMTSRRTT